MHRLSFIEFIKRVAKGLITEGIRATNERQQRQQRQISPTMDITSNISALDTTLTSAAEGTAQRVPSMRTKKAQFKKNPPQIDRRRIIKYLRREFIHLPVSPKEIKGNHQKTCFLCTKKTQYKCNQCNEVLCYNPTIDPDNPNKPRDPLESCFVRYHEQNLYLSKMNDDQ